MRATRWVLVLAIAAGAACFGSKRGSRGTNTTAGNGSDNDGPWNGGSSPAYVER